MAGRALPNLGLTGFWTLGEDNWNDENDLNLLKLSVLVQPVVADIVAAEPGSPADGDVYILDETHGTHPNEIAVRDDGAWVYIEPVAGWMVHVTAGNAFYKFSGAAWTEFEGGGGGSSDYRVGFFFTTSPTASEVLLLHTFTDAVTFADDFANGRGSVGTNPAATFTMDVQKNGASVGSIAISTGGVFTFATTGGPLTFDPGDQLKIVGPGSPGTAANVSITLKGSL